MILRASQQSARAYRNILRYSQGLPPWHAGHVEITGEKNGRDCCGGIDRLVFFFVIGRMWNTVVYSGL